MMKKALLKKSFRDAAVEQLKARYTDIKVRKSADPYAFYITGKNFTIPDGLEWGTFYEKIAMNNAQYTFSGGSTGFRITVKNYRGHFYPGRD